MATLFQLPKAVPISSGNGYSGAKAYFYQSGTTTPITTYTTAALSVAHANPVVADANGVFAPIFIDESVNESYKLKLNTSSDVLIYEVDSLPSLQTHYIDGDVRKYGAVGDGSTDDSAAAAAAVSALNGTGGIIYFPKGAYLIDDAALQNLDRVTIIGDGHGDNVQPGATRLLLKTGTRTSLISTASNVRSVSVRDMDLEGQGNETAGVTGIFNNASSHCDYERLYVKGFKGTVGTRGRGIRLHAGTAGTGGYFNRLSNIKIGHSSSPCGIGVEGTITDSLNSPNMNTLIDVDVFACDSDGVKINGSNTYGWQFFGGQSSFNAGDGYDFEGHSHQFYGPVPEGNTGAGFRNATSAANYVILPAHYMQSASNAGGDFVGCAPGIMALTNQETTPSALANGNNNNYDIGQKPQTLLRLSGDAGGGSSLTGFGFRQDGQKITIVNVSANPIFIDNESSNSTAANRILTPGGLQMRLKQNDSISAVYDGTSDRWRVLSETVSVIRGSATFDPSNLADGAGETTTVTATGAALGDFASATFSLNLQGITLTAWVSATDTVSVRFQNESGGAVDLNSGTLRVKVEKA